MEKRFADLAGSFEDCVARMAGRGGWWPSPEDPTGRSLIRLRELGAPERAVRDDEWLSEAYRSLRRWQAFRGPKGGVSELRFRDALSGIEPQLAPFRNLPIDRIGRGRLPDLFDLFRGLADLKPSRAKWVSISKTLYHLLPELVMPTDGVITARFLGRSTLPEGLDAGFLTDLYGNLTAVARSVGGKRLDELGTDPSISDARLRSLMRLGRARVLDLAMAGSIGM